MVSSIPLVMTAKAERIGTDSCPNCNADAVVIVERPKPKSHFWMMYIRCDKCRGKFFVDFMADEHKRLVDRRTELTKRYEQAKTPKERGTIYKEIQRLQEREKAWIQSL